MIKLISLYRFVVLFLLLTWVTNAMQIQLTTPSKFYIGTWAISSWLNGCHPSISGFGTTGLDFQTAMRDKITSKYPNTSWHYYDDYRDDQVTFHNFVDPTESGDDLLFYGGHGGSGDIPLYTCDIEYFFDGELDASYFSNGFFRFSGATKWVISYSCRTMNYNAMDECDPYFHIEHNYEPIFRGLHTLAGFVSNAWPCNKDCTNCFLFWCTQYAEDMHDLYNSFANRWITNGDIFYNAWFQAVQEVYNTEPNIRPGAELKVIGVYGQINLVPPPGCQSGCDNNWHTFDGTSELYAQTANVPLPLPNNLCTGTHPSDICTYWRPNNGNALIQVGYIFGSPDYSTPN